MTENLDILNTKCLCPDCGSPDFIMGPEGGMAVNIKCAKCQHTFWFGPPFSPERIADTGDWAYTRPPVNLWNEAYGMIVPSPAWAEKPKRWWEFWK